MSIKIYYNFPSTKFLGISVENISAETSFASVLYPSSDAAAIKYDDASYFPIQILVFVDSANTNWCVVECRVNKDIDNNRIYFAMKLNVTGDTATANDMNNFIQALAGNVSSDVSLDINKIIDTANSSNASINRTGKDVTIIYDKSINISSMPMRMMQNENRYNTQQRNINLSVGGASAVLTKKALEWYIDCEMVGEHDMEKTIKIKVDKSPFQSMMENTLLTIIFAVALFTIYIGTPIIYEMLIIPSAETIKKSGNNALPLKSIDIYWVVISWLFIFTTIIFAFKSQNVMFYMLALFWGVLVVVTKSSIKTNFGNIYGDQITSKGQAINIDADYFALFKSDKKYPIGVMALSAFGAWLPATILAFDYREEKHKATTMLVKNVEEPTTLFIGLMLVFMLFNLSIFVYIRYNIAGFLMFGITIVFAVLMLVAILLRWKKLRPVSKKLNKKK